MHTEHNVWLNTLDIIYHEAIQQETMESFLKVLAGPQTEVKLKSHAPPAVIHQC